jgi:hypothetical protein
MMRSMSCSEQNTKKNRCARGANPSPGTTDRPPVNGQLSSVVSYGRLDLGFTDAGKRHARTQRQQLSGLQLSDLQG